MSWTIHAVPVSVLTIYTKLMFWFFMQQVGDTGPTSHAKPLGDPEHE